MKKVALVLPEQGLPVPAVMGGAIESLVELLADENEVEKKLDLTIYSRYDSDAEKKSKAYKHSKFVYIKERRNVLVKTRYALKKFLKIGYIGDFYAQVFADCEKNNYDFIIAEGGHYPAFRKFSERFGKDKLMLHIHHCYEDNEAVAGIFGSTISVSHFVNDVWSKSRKAFPNDNDQKNFTLINAVNEDRFTKKFSDKERKELREKLGFSDDDIVVEYLGRILEVKGVKELVQAVINLNNPHIKLLTIGSAGFADNPKQNYYDEVVAMIKDNDCGVQLGYVDNKEVYKYAKIADIRCFPAKWEEAISLALIEALHCGTPIVATRSGGMPEVVPDDGGIIINKDERLVPELKQAIKKLASSKELREKMAAVNLKEAKRFRKEIFYNNFVDIIEGEVK